jgi:hypothetical protein
MPRIICLLSLAFALLQPTASWAHGSFDSKPALDGAVHVLTSPLCYALLLGLVIVSAHVQEQMHYSLVGMATLGSASASLILSLSGFAWHPMKAEAFSAAGAAVIGLIAVVGVYGEARKLLALALITGIWVTCSSQLETFRAWNALGIAFVVMMMALVGYAAHRTLEAWPPAQHMLPLAKRIAGAWIACMSLLVFSLAVVKLVGPKSAMLSLFAH